MKAWSGEWLRVFALAITLVIAVAACTSGQGATTGKQIVIGYAGLSNEYPFVRSVNQSLEQNAARYHAKLIELDNKLDPQVALSNADTLITEGAQVIIEFQTDAAIAPALCQKFTAAHLKVIAIDIPHEPCAYFYGADNKLAGTIAGEQIAKVAEQRWGRQPDYLVLLELPQSGNLPLLRTNSYLDGVRKVFPNFPSSAVIKLDSKNSFQPSFLAMQNIMSKLAGKKVLVGAVNDPAAAGALRAIQDAGLANDFIIGGQNATVEARTPICNNDPTFVGSVAYFPERYGDDLIPLAIDLVNGKIIPKYNYVHHVWIDHSNITKYYPNC